ncbi:hypothetical protein K0M31_002855 [Melipona bicolor]|uniref:Uncharacterized protein n=1 Tax=Melipona bicolor TaxID=60889 RepID=A0AA40FZS6_9HYME|nr:hypothetical protein K0M31_002855 [Melipona bicolor]
MRVQRVRNGTKRPRECDQHQVWKWQMAQDEAPVRGNILTFMVIEVSFGTGPTRIDRVRSLCLVSVIQGLFVTSDSFKPKEDFLQFEGKYR